MKTKNIIWTKSHPDYAYFVDDVCEMPEKQANALLKSKHVKLYKEPEKPEPVCDLPEDFPGRDVLIAHGLIQMEEVKKIKDFTEINGIGKSLNKQIHDFLNAE